MKYIDVMVFFHGRVVFMIQLLVIIVHCMQFVNIFGIIPKIGNMMGKT